MSDEVEAHGRLDFQDVHDRFHNKIRRYLERLAGAEEADDMTQEVFAKVSRALPRFRGDSSVSTWIYRIATNIAYDKLRSSSSQRAGEVPIDSDDAPVKDPSSGIEQQLVRREMS